MSFEDILLDFRSRFVIEESEKNIEVISVKHEKILPKDAIAFAVLLSSTSSSFGESTRFFFVNNKNLFLNVEIRDLQDGLTAIVTGKKPSCGFEFLREVNLLEIYFPWLYDCYGVKQNEYHSYDVYYHLIYSCDSAVPELIIRLSALFHDIGKVKAKRKIQKGEDEKDVFYNHEIIGTNITFKVLKQLGFEKKLIKKVSRLVRYHMFHYTPEWTDKAVRRFIKTADIDMEDLFKLREADRNGNNKRVKTTNKMLELKNRIKHVIEYDSRKTAKDLAVNGYDIMEIFGLKEGPVVGKILNHLLHFFIEDESRNEKEILIVEAKKYYESLKTPN